MHPWLVHSVYHNSGPYPRLATNPYIKRPGGTQMDPPGPSLLERCPHVPPTVALRGRGPWAQPLIPHSLQALLARCHPVRVLAAATDGAEGAAAAVAAAPQLHGARPVFAKLVVHSHVDRDWEASLERCTALVLALDPIAAPDAALQAEAAAQAAAELGLRHLILLLPGRDVTAAAAARAGLERGCRRRRPRSERAPPSAGQCTTQQPRRRR